MIVTLLVIALIVLVVDVIASVVYTRKMGIRLSSVRGKWAMGIAGSLYVVAFVTLICFL